MKHSSIIVLLLAATFIVDGAISPSLTPKQENALALVHGLLITILCYCWCRAEAEERGSVTPGRSALWAGLFPYLGLPIYFLRTRSKAHAAKSTGKALALLVVLSLADAGIAEVLLAVRA